MSNLTGERSLSIDSSQDEEGLLFSEDHKEKEYFLLTHQQDMKELMLPYQESVTSYNTADFTKFSIGELSNKLQRQSNLSGV